VSRRRRPRWSARGRPSAAADRAAADRIAAAKIPEAAGPSLEPVPGLPDAPPGLSPTLVDLPTRARRATTWMIGSTLYVFVPGLLLLVSGDSISDVPPAFLVVWGILYVLHTLAGTPPKVRAGRDWISNTNGRTWVRLDALTKVRYEPRSLIQMELRDAHRRVRLDDGHLEASPVLLAILTDACRDAYARLDWAHVQPPTEILDRIGDLPPRRDPRPDP
jgi:hypothetical protein